MQWINLYDFVYFFQRQISFAKNSFLINTKVSMSFTSTFILHTFQQCYIATLKIEIISILHPNFTALSFCIAVVIIFVISLYFSFFTHWIIKAWIWNTDYCMMSHLSLLLAKHKLCNICVKYVSFSVTLSLLFLYIL